LDNLGKVLKSSFVWEGSPEGHQYWADYCVLWENIPCSGTLLADLVGLSWDTNKRQEFFRDLIRASKTNPKAPQRLTKYHDRFGNLPSFELLNALS